MLDGQNRIIYPLLSEMPKDNRKRRLPGFGVEAQRRYRAHWEKYNKAYYEKQMAEKKEDEGLDSAELARQKKHEEEWISPDGRPYEAASAALTKEEWPEQCKNWKGSFYEAYSTFIPFYMNRHDFLLVQVSYINHVILYHWFQNYLAI